MSHFTGLVVLTAKARKQKGFPCLYFLYLFRFMISKVGQFSCNLKGPQFLNPFSETQGCFINLNVANHGHLR